jgi:hypothetical protein
MRVSQYFKMEFSDSSLEDCIARLARSGDKNIDYWFRKVRKVIDFYIETNRFPADAAGHLARILRPRLKELVRKEKETQGEN